MRAMTSDYSSRREAVRWRSARGRRRAAHSLSAGHPPDLRVVFITDIVTPYTVAVMGELAQLVDLTVIFSEETSSRGCEWTFDDLPFPHLLNGGLAIKRSDPDASDYYLNPRVLLQLRDLRPDVVISAGWSVPTWYAALHCRATGSSLVIQSDGTPRSERHLSRLQRVSRATLMRVAAGFAANSRQAAQRFIDLGAAPDTVHSAPHSTNLEPYWEQGRRRLYDRTGARRDHQADGGGLRVLMVGRLVARKGFGEVIPAVAVAQQVEPGIRVSIVGAGPDERRLRSLGRDLGVPLEFLGFIDQPDLAAVCGQADAFVFPSTRGETFGLALLEALAAGMACIASPFAGATDDLIVDGENGLVVDPYDYRRLADTLVALARDPALRRRIGERGHRLALQRTPRRTAEGYAHAAESARRAQS